MPEGMENEVGRHLQYLPNGRMLLVKPGLVKRPAVGVMKYKSSGSRVATLKYSDDSRSQWHIPGFGVLGVLAPDSELAVPRALGGL
jgi:hypothetical protein